MFLVPLMSLALPPDFRVVLDPLAKISRAVAREPSRDEALLGASLGDGTASSINDA